MTTTNGPTPTEHLNLDILIIGAGFGGCYALHTLRNLNPPLSTHVFEAAPTLGGVWHWNTYPGARVDSEIPYYQYSIPEVWRHWTWSERFPGVEELQAYFRHVDNVLDLSKDITFNASVVDARYDEESAKWTITTENGHVAVAMYLICATGSSYKPHYPAFKNLHAFKGQLIHSTRYPADANTKGTRVAIIGSGATAVQCTQEIAKTAAHLSVYIRTASISLPMVQRELTEIEQRINKASYNSMFAYTKQTNSGLGYDMRTGSVYDLTDEQREELWEELWNRGGFNFNQSNYRDFLFDTKANALMYQFWGKKVRARIKNPEKAAFLAPEKPPFAFGTKRSSLEQDYYECLDQDNVQIFDLKANPIEEFTETGIVSQDGVLREFDTIVLATGFDAMTGSLTSMDLRGRDGDTVKELWREGVLTHLGLCINKCPNMFMVYGPQAPTAFTNGPTFIEVQVNVVADFIQKLRKEEIKSIEARLDAAKQWKDMIQADNNKTLLPLTDSWYMGANIPGKPREQLNYLRGVRQYNEDCRAALENFEGFDVIYHDDRPRIQSHI